MRVLQNGDEGPEVRLLQQRLEAAGFDPAALDGRFGFATRSALMAFQNSRGLPPTGVADEATLAALGLFDADAGAGDSSVIAFVDAETVAQLFPDAPFGNIEAHLPFVLNALDEQGLGDREMVLMALATIRAETAGFEPLDEFRSQFNTSPGGHPFDKYDNRADLGNQGPPDGERYKGRGFIQLTGRDNYRRIGQLIGLGDDLEDDPDLANEPEIAARILAAFLQRKEAQIRAALAGGDLAQARKLVNGGSHGLAQFTQAFMLGEQLLV